MNWNSVLFAATCLLVAGLLACEPPQEPTTGPEDPDRAPPAQQEPDDEPAAEDPANDDDPQPEEFVDEGPEETLMYRPDDLEWEDGPDSFEEGSEMAILEGDPGEHAVFTMRFRLPDGFEINPHTHPAVERVTVISGTFNLGHDEEFGEGDVTELPAGSHFSIPPGHVHYAYTEGETIIQLSSVGPWEIEYVDSADDPRLRAQR